MTEFDENGNSTDPADPAAIDPTHPNYMKDPRWDRVRKAWAKAHGTQATTSADVPPTA